MIVQPGERRSLSATTVPGGAFGNTGADVCPGRLDAQVKAITEKLCGHAFSTSSISAIEKRLDESSKAFVCRTTSSGGLC